MQGDILIPPDTVKSSKSITGDKQYSDMSKICLKHHLLDMMLKRFRLTIPSVTTPNRMPKTFVPQFSSTSNLPVTSVSATINDAYGTFTMTSVSTTGTSTITTQTITTVAASTATTSNSDNPPHIPTNATTKSLGRVTNVRKKTLVFVLWLLQAQLTPTCSNRDVQRM